MVDTPCVTLAEHGPTRLDLLLALNLAQVYMTFHLSLSTFILIDSSEIPVNEYYEYFGPDYELDVKSSNADDMNTATYLDRVKRIVLENLRHTGGPPSVQMSGMASLH